MTFMWYDRLRKLSVKWKIFLLSAGVFGLSLTAGFAYFTYQSYWLNVTTALNGLMNFTDAKQQGVIRFIDQNEKLAKQLANLVEHADAKTLRGQFQSIVATDVFRLEEHPFKDEIISGKRSIPTWTVYHAIDYVADGVIRVSSDPQREGKVWGKPIDLKPGYTDPYFDGDVPVMTFAAQTHPLPPPHSSLSRKRERVGEREQAGKGAFTPEMSMGGGTVYVHADARMLTNIVSGEIGNLAGDMGAYYLAGVGKTFDYYLVNKENLLITESRIRPGQFLKGHGSDAPWRTTQMQAGVMCGSNGMYTTNGRCTTGCREVMGFYIGATGKKMLGASMPFYDSSWTLVVEQEADELLMPMWVMFAEQFGMLLLISALAIYLYLRLQDRTIIHPLKKLQQAVEELEQTQDFGKPINFKSQDEFGVLADSFNRMSKKLESVYNYLEQRVADRTRELFVSNEQIRASLLASEQAHRKLQDSEHQTRQAMAELQLQKLALDEHAIVSITDVTGKIIYANDRFCRISQYSREELIGQNHRMLNSGHHPTVFFKEMFRVITHGEVWHNEVCNRAKDGSLYWLDMTVVPFMDEHGKPYQYVAIRTDITIRKKSEQEIEQLAYYDPLTSLPNRRLLMDRLRQTLLLTLRQGGHGAVSFIDLDNFKNLNDTQGHAIGDQLLVEVAHRLKHCVREEDTVARLGGDEFVILLSNLSENHNEAAAAVERITDKVLIELNRPYWLNGIEHFSSPSIGITLFCDSQSSVDDLLKKADSAMYEAKKAGRNTVRFYDPTTQAVLEARGEIEQGLRHAIEHSQLQLYYQIQVNEDGRVIGAEALLRWFHPDMGMVSPARFIPVAEESGLILPIGRWVLETACAQIKRWENNPLACHLVLAVNVSGRQFREPGFVGEVGNMLVQSGIDPARLKLEITESMILDNVPTVISVMTELKSLGVKFSMDDFGTGYSSLSYIKQLPIDQLKIDQSFVRDLVHDKNDRAIVRAIIAMATSLGMEVIAEGVEIEEQRQLLSIKGCNNWQGYLFGKPLPLSEFEALLNRKNAA